MKVLIAIPSGDPKSLLKGALSWVGRTGYELRIFVPSQSEKTQYQAQIEEINYQEFLSLNRDIIVPSMDVVKYAQQHSFDVAVILPAELKRWNKEKNIDKMVLNFAADVGAVRKRMNQEPKYHIRQFDNGAMIVRIVKL